MLNFSLFRSILFSRTVESHSLLIVCIVVRSFHFQLHIFLHSSWYFGCDCFKNKSLIEFCRFSLLSAPISFAQYHFWYFLKQICYLLIRSSFSVFLLTFKNFFICAHERLILSIHEQVPFRYECFSFWAEIYSYCCSNVSPYSLTMSALQLFLQYDWVQAVLHFFFYVWKVFNFIYWRYVWA